MYPNNWPRCVSCGDFALDGHLTCGRAGCDEGGSRERRDELYRISKRFREDREPSPHTLEAIDQLVTEAYAQLAARRE